MTVDKITFHFCKDYMCKMFKQINIIACRCVIPIDIFVYEFMSNSNKTDPICCLP